MKSVLRHFGVVLSVMSMIVLVMITDVFNDVRFTRLIHKSSSFDNYVYKGSESNRVTFNRHNIDIHPQKSHEQEPSILLITYLRSGSTFVADILQQIPDIFYVYEPFRQYISVGNSQEYFRQNQICSLFNETCRPPRTYLEYTETVVNDTINLFKCNILDLPDFFLRRATKSRSIAELRACLREKQVVEHIDNDIIECYQLAKLKCQSGPKLIKTIRLSMEIVKTLMERMPLVKVVFLMRDPRAVFASRSREHYIKKTMNPNTVVRALCQRFTLDIFQSLKLVQKVGINFKIFMYEDFAERPLETAKSLFEFTGVRPAADFYEWLLNHTYANLNHTGKRPHYGTIRPNATMAAIKWRKYIDFSIVKMIDKECNKVYQYMGLRDIENSEMLSDINIPLRIKPSSLVSNL